MQALRLANARHDREILRRLCVAWDTLTGATLEVERVLAGATLLGGDFLRSWADMAVSETREPAASLVRTLRAELVDRLEFPGIVDRFLEAGWRPWEAEFGQDLRDEVELWKELHAQLQREHGDITLHAYLQAMDLSSKVPPPVPGAVPCLTVHGSKGLEFEHVYLIGMAQEVLPSFQALERGAESREPEQERRSCFVAMTRARETLTLTWARSYRGWPKAPSQFLAEMGPDVRLLGNDVSAARVGG